MGMSLSFGVYFRFLLEEALEAGIYTHYDYDSNPKKYCGLNIDYSPINDPELQDLVKNDL